MVKNFRDILSKYSRIDYLILTVFVLAITLRCFVFLLVDPIIFADTASYAAGSTYIAQNFSFAKISNQRPFLYPAIIGIIHHIFNESNKAVVLFQHLCGLLNMLILYLIGRKIFLSKIPTFIMLLLYSLDMHLLSYETAVVADSLHAFTTLLYVYFFILFIYDSKNRKNMFANFAYAFLIGFLLFIDVVLRQISQFVLPVLALFILIDKLYKTQTNHPPMKRLYESLVGIIGLCAGYAIFAMLTSHKMQVETGFYGLSGTVETFPEYFKGNNLLIKYFSPPMSYLNLLFTDTRNMISKTWYWAGVMLWYELTPLFYGNLIDILSTTARSILSHPLNLAKYMLHVIVLSNVYIRYIEIAGIIGASVYIKNLKVYQGKKGLMTSLFLLGIILLHVAVAVTYWTQATIHCWISSYRINLIPLIYILSAGPIYKIIVLLKNVSMKTGISKFIFNKTVANGVFALYLIIFSYISASAVILANSSIVKHDPPAINGIVPWDKQNDASVYTEFACAFLTTMDKSSVEKALYVTDIKKNATLAGKIYWNGDTYVVFVPDDILQPNTSYEFGFSSAATSTAESPLKPYSVRFATEKIAGTSLPYRGCDRRNTIYYWNQGRENG